MRKFVSSLFTVAALAVPAIIQAQAKPVVAVLYFDNNSIGKDRAEYDGVGKGIADMLITDMASNSAITVVERERVQALLTEQNLTKSNAIDPQTAIRLGKIIGAQYMIYGGFLSDGKGQFVLTSRAVNVETGVIVNPVRLTSRGDDVLGLISQLSEKLNKEMKLPALRVGQAGSAPSAQPAGQPAAAPAVESKSAATASATQASAQPAVQVAQAKHARKMDMKTALLYSKALEAEDAGNRTQAYELYRKVVANFPDYAPAQQKIQKLSRG